MLRMQGGSSSEKILYVDFIQNKSRVIFLFNVLFWGFHRWIQTYFVHFTYLLLATFPTHFSFNNFIFLYKNLLSPTMYMRVKIYTQDLAVCRKHSLEKIVLSLYHPSATQGYYPSLPGCDLMSPSSVHDGRWQTSHLFCGSHEGP